MASRIRENGGCTAVCARIWARILLQLLGAAVQHYDVVEIDDGMKPAFFYKTEHGYELLFSFDAKTAKKNIREEID